jgi:hypothetical protein
MPININNQHIYGGNQQFAENIINQYKDVIFETNDVELLKFVGGLKAEEAKKELVSKDIAIINDHTVTAEVKKEAHNRVMQFLLDHKSDISAWAGSITKATIVAILAKYGLSLVDVGLS